MRQTEILNGIATDLRIQIVDAIYRAKSGHPGGSLSVVEILTALYFDVMKHNPNDPHDGGRDRFVLSKGHAAPALYAALAHAGYFPADEMGTLRRLDAMLQGHPDMKGTPGVDFSTGALGIGISAACGMAIAARIYGDDYRVYTVVGDGELQSGLVWEAAMFAAHNKLDNLMVIVDNNGLQIDGRVEDVMNPNPIADKFRAFGWEVGQADGHDFNALFSAFDTAKETKGKPFALVAKTVKGKGVSFMENNAAWHGAAPSEEQHKLAISELRGEVVAS